MMNEPMPIQEEDWFLPIRAAWRTLRDMAIISAFIIVSIAVSFAMARWIMTGHLL